MNQNLLEVVTNLYQAFREWCQAFPNEQIQAEFIVYYDGSGGVRASNTEWIASWDRPEDGLRQLRQAVP